MLLLLALCGRLLLGLQLDVSGYLSLFTSLLGLLQIMRERESSAAAYSSCRPSDTCFWLLYLFVKAGSCNSDGSVGISPPSAPLKPRHGLRGVQNAPAAPASGSPVG